MIHLIKGQGKNLEYVGVADDPNEPSHKLWRERGFKPAPKDWEPPKPKAKPAKADADE